MTDLIIDQHHRRFQVWAYSVSLARLLLVSNTSDSFATRYDVLFQNVRAMNLATSLDGLIVRVASVSEQDAILAQSGLVLTQSSTTYIVESQRFVGFVVASLCVGAEGTGAYLDESGLWVGF